MKAEEGRSQRGGGANGGGAQNGNRGKADQIQWVHI